VQPRAKNLSTETSYPQHFLDKAIIVRPSVPQKSTLFPNFPKFPRKIPANISPTSPPPASPVRNFFPRPRRPEAAYPTTSLGRNLSAPRHHHTANHLLILKMLTNNLHNPIKSAYQNYHDTATPRHGANAAPTDYGEYNQKRNHRKHATDYHAQAGTLLRMTPNHFLQLRFDLPFAIHNDELYIFFSARQLKSPLFLFIFHHTFPQLPTRTNPTTPQSGSQISIRPFPSPPIFRPAAKSTQAVPPIPRKPHAAFKLSPFFIYIRSRPHRFALLDDTFAFTSLCFHKCNGYHSVKKALF
jgi:hypothetical protein